MNTLSRAAIVYIQSPGLVFSLNVFIAHRISISLSTLSLAAILRDNFYQQCSTVARLLPYSLTLHDMYTTARKKLLKILSLQVQLAILAGN